MSTALEIPLSAASQRVRISLSGTTYQLTVRWCDPAGCWYIDIADALGNALVSGIAMITGTDLLAPFRYLGFVGQLVAQTDSNKSAPPTFSNLGSRGHLYYVTP